MNLKNLRSKAYFWAMLGKVQNCSNLGAMFQLDFEHSKRLICCSGLNISNSCFMQLHRFSNHIWDLLLLCFIGWFFFSVPFFRISEYFNFQFQIFAKPVRYLWLSLSDIFWIDSICRLVLIGRSYSHSHFRSYCLTLSSKTS